jgi:cob(I)alamin adenosyltransferase
VRIYTRKGDDGTTGLLYGGRVGKDSPRIEVNGVVDEAQAALGVARAEAEPGSALDDLLVGLERDLYVLMAEVATAPERRDRLVAGASLVTPEMVASLEERIDELTGQIELSNEFVVPGGNRRAAALDLARTVVRRAERAWVATPVSTADDGSQVGAYLNRLSDLVWTMARWQEGDRHLEAPTRPRRGRRASGGGEPTGGTDG